ALENGLDEMPDLEGLLDEQVRAGVQRRLLGRRRGLGADRDDRQVAVKPVLAQQLDGLLPVELGHHDVHQHVVRDADRDAVHAVDPVGRHLDQAPLVLQGEREDACERLLVVDYEDAGCSHAWPSFMRWYCSRSSSAFSASTSRKLCTTSMSNCVPEFS